MRIGVPKEVKVGEYRCGLTPAISAYLCSQGEEVVVQSGAGEGIGWSDELFASSGAKIVSSARQVYECECIVKVKEPLEMEYDYLKEGQLLFCFLHLAAMPTLTRILLEKKVIAIAYESVENREGRLPLLIPMSEIAGRLSIQMGAMALSKPWGGKGILIGGAPGVLPAKIIVLGGGSAGKEALKIAVGLGADVTLIESNIEVMRNVNDQFLGRVKTLYSIPETIGKLVEEADLLIGAVLIKGASAPKIVSEEMVRRMKPKSVIVDISIDQGGCVATSLPTTHAEPTYERHGVIHYCVTNMPGACAFTATLALTNATFPYLLKLLKEGIWGALRSDSALRAGLNCALGTVTIAPVAQEQGLPYCEPSQLLGRILS